MNNLKWKKALNSIFGKYIDPSFEFYEKSLK